MNIITRIIARIMNILKRIKTDKLTGLKSICSDDMLEHIELWADMVSHETEWQKKYGSSGILSDIASAISTPVSEEMTVESENEELEKIMKKLDAKASVVVQYMALRGGCVVVPVFANGKTQFEIVPLGNYIPTSYDIDDTLTGCKVFKTFAEKGKNYLLEEQHEYSDGKSTTKVKLYNIADNGELYEENLERLETTKDMALYIEYDAIMPLFVEFRNRDINNIDGSPTPVAIYSGDEQLIKDCDYQYNILKWEQKAGKTRIFADSDMFRKRQGSDGRPIIPDEMNDVIIKVEGNGTAEEKMQVVSPQLRTEQQINAFNEILRRIENRCKLGKGTLSNLETVNQTATQYTGGKSTLYHTVDMYESELEEKYRNIAYGFAMMLTLYGNVPFNYDIEIKYNDSGRKDPDKVRASALLELQNEIISEVEYRMRVFGETQEEAEAKVPVKESANDYGGIFRMA